MYWESGEELGCMHVQCYQEAWLKNRSLMETQMVRMVRAGEGDLGAQGAGPRRGECSYRNSLGHGTLGKGLSFVKCREIGNIMAA